MRERSESEKLQEELEPLPDGIAMDWCPACGFLDGAKCDYYIALGYRIIRRQLDPSTHERVRLRIVDEGK